MERQVYVISDLHLGGQWPRCIVCKKSVNDSDACICGRPCHTHCKQYLKSSNTIGVCSQCNHYEGKPIDRGFRMMTHLQTLASFIEQLAERSNALELVINGDFIDFLAEDHLGDWYPFISNPAVARKTFLAVAKRDKVIFDALAKLIAKHHLTVIIGNHDLELFLPDVRRAFLQLLGDPGGNHVRFIPDGEAYICGNLIIEHGNRYDSFNEVDHNQFQKLREVASRGMKADSRFKAPLGSHIVSEIMNPIKKDYGFIDLLKPESVPLIALLLALDPNQFSKVQDLVGEISGLNKRDSVFRGRGHASRGDEDDESSAVYNLMADAMGETEARYFLDDFFTDPQSTIYRGDVSQGQGWGAWLGLVPSLLGGKKTETKAIKKFQKALKWVQDEDLFSENVEAKKEYLKGAEELTATRNGQHHFAFVCFGHTHHAKYLKLTSGATYLNTGTWANLMRFPETLFDEDPQRATSAATEFFRDMKANRLGDYIQFDPTYAWFRLVNGHVTHAELRHYEGQIPS